MNLQFLGLNNPDVVLSKPGVSEHKEDRPDMKGLLSITRLKHSYPKPGRKRVVEVFRVQSH